MVSKEEFEKRYNEELQNYEENLLKEALQRESGNPGVYAELINRKNETKEALKSAREHFDDEAKMRAATECREIVDWLSAHIGNNGNIKFEMIHRLEESGFWNRSGTGGYLNMSFKDLMDIVSNTKVDFQGKETPINSLMTEESKEALIQAMYERIGYTEHLPTQEDIKKLEEQGKGEEVFKAKQMAGMGPRRGPISYVDYGEKTLDVGKMGKIYERTSPQDIENAMEIITEERTKGPLEPEQSDELSK